MRDHASAAARRPVDVVVARLERLPFTRFHLHMGAVLSAGTFFYAFDSGAVGIVLALIIASLRLSPVESGVLVSATTLGAFFGSCVTGLVGERWGRKSAFVLALLAFGLLSVASGLAWNFPSLVAFRAVQGVGFGGEISVAAVLFSEWVRGRTRGRVVGLYAAIPAWGLLLSPLVGLLLVSTLPRELAWRALFWVGGLPVLVAIYACFRLPESPRWLAENGRPEAAGRLLDAIEADVRRRGRALPEPEVRSLSTPLQRTRLLELFWPGYRRRTVAVWVQGFTTAVGVSVYYGWFPALYVKLGGLAPPASLSLTVITAAVQLATTYGAASLLDRAGRIPLMQIGFGLMSAGSLFGLVMVVVVHVTPWPVLFVAGTLILISGVCNELTPVVWVPELYPTRMRAWATSSGGAVSRLGGFIAPILTGVFLGQRWGTLGLFLMIAVAALIGLATISRLGVETRRRVLEESSAAATPP